MNAYGVGLGTPHLNIEREALHVRFERFELDEENARLLCDGKPVELPPKPFEVLCALARRPGSLLTKNALLDEVWGHRFVSESVLKTVIGKLRIALRDDARQPRFIETVPRRGYRFIAAEGAAVDDPAASPHIEHRHPHIAASSTAGITAERALREVREMLLLLIEGPQEARGGAARIADYIAGRAPKMANEGR